MKRLLHLVGYLHRCTKMIYGHTKHQTSRWGTVSFSRRTLPLGIGC